MPHTTLPAPAKISPSTTHPRRCGASLPAACTLPPHAPTAGHEAPGHAPAQTPPLPRPPTVSSLPTSDQPTRARPHAPAGIHPPPAPAAVALPLPAQTSSAAPRASPRSDPAPGTRPLHPTSHATPFRTACDRPGSLPPSATKTTTAAAHTTTAPTQNAHE